MDAKIAVYESHHTTFCHYSSLLFRARISIVTALLLVFAFLFGFMPDSNTNGPPIDLGKIPGAAVVTYLAAIAIGLAFKMESAYVGRLRQVARAASQLEKALKVFPEKVSGLEGKPDSFFGDYNDLAHVPIDLLHLVAVSVLLWFAWETALEYVDGVWFLICAFLTLVAATVSVITVVQNKPLHGVKRWLPE